MKKKLLLIGPMAPTGGVGSLLNSKIYILKKNDNIDIFTFNISILKDKPIKIFKLIKLIRKSDIIHIHCSFKKLLNSSQLSIPLIISKVLLKKVLVTYHTGEPENFIKKQKCYNQIIFSFPNIITVPSLEQKRIFLKYNIQKDKKILVLPNFIDEFYEKKSSELSLKNKKNLIITTGKVDSYNISRKGFDDFIKVARKMPEYRFILVGKISDKEGKLLKEKSPKNLEMTGFISKNELAQYYAQSKVCLLLSRSESFGISVIEGMIFNCIPIVYNRGALPYVVNNEGYIVEYKDLDEVIKCIHNSFKFNKNFNPRKRVLKNFTSDSYFKKYLNILENFIR